MRNAVIFHHPDGVDTSREKLLGRHAAGEGFLSAFVRHAGVEELFAETVSADHYLDFSHRVRQIAGRNTPCRRVTLKDYGLPAVPTVLNLPIPGLSGFAWRRRQIDKYQAHSICGVNHTVASPAVMESLTDLVRAPLAEWDALICTSQASKSAITHVIEAECDYLEERFGVRPAFPLQMPVIPLGVDCSRFQGGKRAESDRAHLRAGLGVGDDDIAMLYLGRLSYRAKAHPMPMFTAAEEATRRTGRRIHLIMAGWFANDTIAHSFREAARNTSPSVRTVFLDGRDIDVRERIWHAADMLVSLSDNVQETFALAPIEAMAAGLPVIVSNWGSYRETVRDGIDGMLIPTWAPPPGDGGDLVMEASSGIAGPDDEKLYDHYCGNVSQAISVDTQACIEAMVALILEPEKRAEMAAAGRRRAREVFDWRHVVMAYQQLWGDLDERRRRVRSAGRDENRTFVPARPDPFTMFAAYPSHVIHDMAEIQPVRGGNLRALTRRLDEPMNNFALPHLLGRDDLETILAIVADTGGLRVKGLAGKLVGREHDRLDRSILWLAKMNLVRLRAQKNSGSDGKTAASSETAYPADETANDSPALRTEPPLADPVRSTLSKEAVKQPATDVGVEVGGSTRDVVRIRSQAALANEKGDLASAESSLVRARQLAPEDTEVNRELGTVRAARGQFAEAEPLFRAVLDREPDDVAALCDLGKVLFLAGKESESVHAFRRAVRVAPDDGGARYLLGLALRRSGANNEAVRCLRIAAEIETENVPSRYHLGLALETLGRHDEASRSFEDARRIDPGDRLVEAAILSAEAASICRVRDVERLRKVVFHLSSPADFPTMKAVFQALGENCWPLISADEHQIVSFAADGAVVLDGDAGVARRLSGDGPVLQLPGGAARDSRSLANAVMADRIGALTANDIDVLIAAGVGREKIDLTGLALADPVFAGKRIAVPRSFDTNRRRAVFAPHLCETSAAVMFGDVFAAVLAVLPDDMDMLIWPRPETMRGQPSWVAGWERLCAQNNRLRLITDPGLNPIEVLSSADLLIADPSDRAALFVAVDRPIILSGQRHGGLYALTDRVAGAIEQASYPVFEADRLAETVQGALHDPEAMSEQRARARSVIFDHGTDGANAERAAAAVLKTIGV